MLGPTHRSFGIVASSALLVAFGENIPVFAQAGIMQRGALYGIVVASGIIGASFPDIDHILPVHRGITHAMWLPALLLWLSFFKVTGNPWLSAVCLGAGIGYASHLVGDAFSKAGIAWFYPIQNYVRYPSGAFVVKGFRGPFLPLYEVGSGPKCVKALWRCAAAISLGMLSVKYGAMVKAWMETLG